MFTITPASPEDAEALSRIALAAKQRWGYPERWLAGWRDQLTVTAQDIRQGAAFAAHAEQRIVGFYLMTQRESLAQLEHLWVLPEAMGRGVGRALFEHATAQARLAGAASLEVESDPNAEGFYLRMGCQPAGEHVYELEGQPRRLPVLRLAVAP